MRVSNRMGIMGASAALAAMSMMASPAMAGLSAMDELRSRDSGPEHRLRPYAGKPFRARSHLGGGKRRPAWFKGSRWAKKATRRGGNSAKQGPAY